MTINQSSIYMWKRETTKGAAVITAVGDTAYQFGCYSDKIPEWDIQTFQNTIERYYNQSSLSPILIYGNRENMVFRTKCHPNSPIPEYQFLGIGTAATPSTVTLLDTGIPKDAYTIRHEERDGTNQLIQKVGCYNIGITGKIEMNTDELIMQDWVWETLEDNGDRSPLTAASQVIYPESLRTVYTGKPVVTWGGVAFAEVFLVNWAQQQNFTAVKNGVNQTINLHEYEAVKLHLTAITINNTKWDAFRDQTTHDVNVTVYKQGDNTKYKTLKFKNVNMLKIHKHGKVETGYYMTTMECMAESITVDFINEFSTLTDWMPTTA